MQHSICHLNVPGRCTILAQVSTSGRRRPLRRTGAAATSTAPENLLAWLHEQGAPQQKLSLSDVDIDGRKIDVSVASEDLRAGDIALRMPEHLVVTLDRVFEDETVAELLTTDKLSELACLALYLMYEKKRGKASRWHAYIKELDRQRARGQLAVESPLLWTPDEIELYLKGSPVKEAVRSRLASMKIEYDALDTVWFMAGSLFRNYPYDVPTEVFSFEVFKQAFAAVQASIVHLQGVGLAKRFALVPLGPPSLSYSSTSKATIAFNPDAKEVQLRVDRDYKAGETVTAWCGPQPNSRLLINYGIVDESNPYDKLSVTATIPNTDPLYQKKRVLLQRAELSTQQVFQLQRNKPLPPKLLPFLRACYYHKEEQLQSIDWSSQDACAAGYEEMERDIIQLLISYVQGRLDGYSFTREEDVAMIASDSTPPRLKVACRLLLIEKIILQDTLTQLLALPLAPPSLHEPVLTCSLCVKLI